jgi:uncharacterized membrane protein YfcA
MSNTLRVGQVLGIIGGVIAVIGLVLFLDLEEDDAADSLILAALLLLVMCMCFALAGAFTKNRQWSWKMLMFMDFLTLGVIAGATVAEYFELWFGCVEFAVVTCIFLVAYTRDAKDWTAEPHQF